MKMQSAMAYEILGLTRWPFNLAPNPEEVLYWADRKEFLKQIQRLVRRLKAHQSSSLHLLWADFGAGKSHTLLYLKQLALTEAKESIIPVYTVLPKSPRSFIDVYRSIVSGMGIETIVKAYALVKQNNRTYQNISSGMCDSSQLLSNVFEGLRIGNNVMKNTAQKWILADPSLTSKEVYNASLPNKIRTADDAIMALSTITHILLSDSHQRVLIMVDEFQRSGKLRGGVLDSINEGLHTLFNNCPNGLSLILSFSFGSAKNVKHHLSPELTDRSDPVMLTLPSLNEEEAVVFLEDLINSAKAPGQEVKIGSNVISTIVQYINSKFSIKPRTLIKICGLVLSEGAIDLEDGAITLIDADYTRNLLTELSPSEDKGEGEET